MRNRSSSFLHACLACLAAAAWLGAPAEAAKITPIPMNQPGLDSLAFTVDSIATSTAVGTFNRYRISDGTVSSMASQAPPNSNLSPDGTHLWFTRAVSPYRIGRADLTLASGGIDNFDPPITVTTPFDDTVIGTDSAVWVTNSAGHFITRIGLIGAPKNIYTGNGTISPLGITRGPDGNVWFTDIANRRITRIIASSPSQVSFTDYAVPQLSANTIPMRITGIGTVDGLLWFATQDGFGSVNPATGAVKVVATEAQSPNRIAAASDGTVWLTNGTPFVTQFTPPANYAKLRVFPTALGQSAGLYIHTDGTLYVGDSNGATLAKIAVAEQTPGDTNVVEFYNNVLNHYFITANDDEAKAIDSGAAGPGWTRTGEKWKAWVNGPIPLAAEVCRFYGSTDINPATGQRRGPNSHFYTLEPGECASVKTDPGWTYEFAGKFWLVKPTNKVCPTWTQPIYRVYNNRFAQNDSNHRYMTSTAIYTQMRNAGWIGEDVVACAPLS